MDEASIRKYILETFPDVSVVDAMNAAFFFTGSQQKFPFATIVTTDEHDQASNLSRPGVFRLNVGISKQTFADLFGTDPPSEGESTYDYTALDRLMPHPVYGKMYWVCVLNPSAETFETVRRLLAEAYQAGKR